MDIYEELSFGSSLRGQRSREKLAQQKFQQIVTEINDDIETFKMITNPETSEMTPRDVVKEIDDLINKINKVYKKTPEQSRNKYPFYTALDGNRLQTHGDFRASLMKMKSKEMLKYATPDETEAIVRFGEYADVDDNILDQTIDDLLDKYDVEDPEPIQRSSLPSQSQPLEQEDPQSNLPQAEPDEDHSYFQSFFMNMSPSNHQYTGPYTKLFKKLREGVDPHNSVDALSMAHDISYSLVTNKDEEEEADMRYLHHIDKLNRYLSSRNFSGRYDELLENIETVKNAFSWKKTMNYSVLTQEDFRENAGRPDNVVNHLNDIRSNIHYDADHGTFRHQAWEGYTEKMKQPRKPRKRVQDLQGTRTGREDVESLESDLESLRKEGVIDPKDTRHHPSGSDVLGSDEQESFEFPDTPPESEEDVTSGVESQEKHGSETPSDPSGGGFPRGPHRRPPFPRGHPRHRRQRQGPGGQMLDVYNQRERDKMVYMNNEAMADDPDSVHWLRPSYLKRYKQLEKLQYYASQEHKEIEDYNNELLFDRYSGQGERTERSSKGLNMVNAMAENDINLRFNFDPNKPFYRTKEFIGTKDKDVTFGKGVNYESKYDFINQAYPLYTLPRDYSPAYTIPNTSRINEGISYDEYINAGLGHIYGSKKYDNYCNKIKNYPSSTDTRDKENIRWLEKQIKNVSSKLKKGKDFNSVEQMELQIEILTLKIKEDSGNTEEAAYRRAKSTTYMTELRGRIAQIRAGEYLLKNMNNSLKMLYNKNKDAITTNYMDAPLKNQIDQTPQFPFNRNIFDRVETIRTQGGDIPASIQCDENINRVGANIKDKTPQYNQWSDAYSQHYNRMYVKPRYNSLYYK